MRILVVDDVTDMLVFAEYVFDKHDVTTVTSLADVPMDVEFDVVITDWMMPNGGGVTVLEVARTRWPAARVYVWTAIDDYQLAAIQASGMCHGVLRKPVTVEQMREVVDGDG